MPHGIWNAAKPPDLVLHPGRGLSVARTGALVQRSVADDGVGNAGGDRRSRVDDDGVAAGPAVAGLAHPAQVLQAEVRRERHLVDVIHVVAHEPVDLSYGDARVIRGLADRFARECELGPA